MQLVLQFATARCVDGIQILVALQTAALDSFARRHGTSAGRVWEWVCGGHAGRGVASWNADTRRRETTTGIHAWHAAWRAQAAAAVESATVVRAGSVVAVLAAAHGSGLVQTAIVSHYVAIPPVHHARHSTCREGRHVCIGAVGHAGKGESTRRASVALSGAKGEVTIAVGIGSGRGNACRIQDIGVH